MKPAMFFAASAANMSDGAITIRRTWRGPGVSLSVTSSPLLRSRYCSTTLWMEYQNGIATVLPPSSATLLMPGCTVSAEPAMWFHISTFSGDWLP